MRIAICATFCGGIAWLSAAATGRSPDLVAAEGLRCTKKPLEIVLRKCQ
jgi:hypothetical protein